LTGEVIEGGANHNTGGKEGKIERASRRTVGGLSLKLKGLGKRWVFIQKVRILGQSTKV